jgi:formylglycine-generating enzyme required for sulfatase activity/dienelactone hydrolase
VTGSIVTDPPGADVFVRRYADPSSEWRLVGQTPIEAARLPLSTAAELRIELSGYETAHLATGVPGFYFGRPEVVTLRPEGEIPPDMVFVPGGDYAVRITGFNSATPVHLDPFLIDRYEVTNAQYKEFVDGGGYETEEYWAGLDFVDEDGALSWDEARARMVDATGRAGPAVWEFGDYPEGEGAYPVNGVSWYEAVAYTRFRDKSLPTIYHWSRAALEPHNNSTPLASAMLPLANFGGDGPVEVGSTGAMGPHGAFDMAGNVKEWTWNASGEHHWLLGGAWDDEPRMHSVRFTSPPFDRSSRHGFRGVRYLGDAPSSELSGPVDLVSRDYRNAQPVSDEVYEVYRSVMAYVPSELAAETEAVDDPDPNWVREHVTIEAGYEDERLSVYLFLPTEVTPPYEAMVFFTGLGPFQTQPLAHSSELIQISTGRLSMLGDVVRSGRAVVMPVFNGSYERWDDFLSQSGEQYLRSMRTRMAEWRSDLGRTIDYLETRDDIRADAIGYFGVSFGASTSLPLLALEERLAAALLLLPGYTYRDMPSEADAINYVPRATLPVLMVGGSYDYVFPVETTQRPLFDQLGTPPEDKRHILYEMGHGAPFPRNQFLRDVLPWLDEYLGPVR